MTPHRLPALLTTLLLAMELLATPTQAQTPAAGVVRCGNSYSNVPCSGGQPVAADDTRSAEQRRQAQEVATKDAAMANGLAAERHGREQAVAGQLASRIGPMAASPEEMTAKTAKPPKKHKSAKAPKSALTKPKLSKGKPLPGG